MNINIYTGMGKNASSFLREYFLQLNLLTIVQEEKYDVLKKIMDYSLRKPYYLLTKEEKDNIINELKLLANQKNIDNILIGATDFSGAYYNNYFHETNALLAIKEIFSKYNPKIIFIFRKQDDFLESQYRELITRGYKESLETFLNYRNNEFGIYSRGSFKINISVEDLNYYEHIKHLYNLFGKEKVLALPVELLKIKKEETLKKICAFLDTKYIDYEPSNKNESLDINSLLLIKKINNVVEFLGLKKIITKYIKGEGDVKKIISKVKFWKTDNNKKFINNEMRKKILLLHAIDNQKLSELIDIDLKDLGYYN